MKSYRSAGGRGQDDINCTDGYGVLVRGVPLYIPKAFQFSTIIVYFQGSHLLPSFYATNRIYSQLAERWVSTKDRLGDNVQIVMLEKHDCILSKRATRPVYI